MGDHVRVRVPEESAFVSYLNTPEDQASALGELVNIVADTGPKLGFLSDQLADIIFGERLSRWTRKSGRA